MVGLLALHVDDALGGRTDALKMVMKKVGEKLLIGSHETAADEKGFFYKGLRVPIAHHESGFLRGKFEVLLDGNDYLDSVILMDEPAGEDDRFLNPSESKDFRSVAGCVGYMASAFRCDFSVETSMLGRSFFAPTVLSAKKANATVVFAKENRYVLSFRSGVEKLLVLLMQRVQMRKALKAVGFIVFLILPQGELLVLRIGSLERILEFAGQPALLRF